MLENKLGITNSVELSKEEEKITKLKALKLFDTNKIEEYEIGTFKGDSASAALNYMKKTGINKRAYFIDTYEGFNYEQAFKSNDTFWKKGHTNTSYDNVKERLSKYDNANASP